MGRYYLFVIFVFFLALLFLAAVRYLFPKKAKSDKLDKNEKLLRLYRQIEDMMDSFEAYAEEVKGEIESEKNHVLKQMDEHYQELIKKSENIDLPTDKKKAESSKKPVSKEKGQESPQSRTDQIRKMYADGMPLSDIAKALNVTVSEIRLIIDVKH